MPQLKKWDADVDALAAEGKKANAEAGAAYDERIKDLRASRDAAQRTFLEICQATESARAPAMALQILRRLTRARRPTDFTEFEEPIRAELFSADRGSSSESARLHQR